MGAMIGLVLQTFRLSFNTVGEHLCIDTDADVARMHYLRAVVSPPHS